MDSRILQQINEEIVLRTEELGGNDITRSMTSSYKVTAVRPNEIKESPRPRFFAGESDNSNMVFLKGNATEFYLDKIAMPATYGNQSMLQFIQEICADNNVVVDTSERIYGLFLPFSFPLAQKYDESGLRVKPAFFVTCDNAESLSIAFPLDGSSPPARIAGGQTKYPLRSDRPCMVVDLEILNGKLRDVTMRAFDPVIIDVSNDTELGEPIKYNNNNSDAVLHQRKQFNEVVRRRMEGRVRNLESRVANANIVTSNHLYDALNSHLKQYNVDLFRTNRLIPALIQRATGIEEEPMKMSYRFNKLDSMDVFIHPVSDASFADSVTKFKRVFGDGVRVLDKDEKRWVTIRVPNAAMMDQINVMHAAIDAVFSDAKILQGYQAFCRCRGCEPDFDKLSWEERFEAQNKLQRQEMVNKLDGLTSVINEYALQEGDPKLQKAERQLVSKLGILAKAALSADTTKSEINAKNEEVRKAIAKVEYRWSGMREGLFRIKYKELINQVQDRLSASQAYKK